MLHQEQSFTESITAIRNVNWANHAAGGENGFPFLLAGRTPPAWLPVIVTTMSRMSHQIASAPDTPFGAAP
jgi:hypothetical protein